MSIPKMLREELITNSYPVGRYTTLTFLNQPNVSSLLKMRIPRFNAAHEAVAKLSGLQVGENIGSDTSLLGLVFG